MKWDFKMVVLLVEWSSFRGGLKAGFTVISIHIGLLIKTDGDLHRSFLAVFLFGIYKIHIG